MLFYSSCTQTQEREAKAEMRRKAKELQQARRDAERSGKKVPAFGGFGSAGMTSVSSGSIITDTIVEPEKPKITSAPVRYNYNKCTNQLLFVLNIVAVVLVCITMHLDFFSFSDQVDPVRL